MAASTQLIGLLVISTLMAALGQILFKLGAAQLNSPLISLEFPAEIATNPRILGGLALYAFSTLIWIGALTRAQLNFVYAFTALTLFLVFIFSRLMLEESAGIWHILGYSLVILGLILVFLGYNK